MATGTMPPGGDAGSCFGPKCHHILGGYRGHERSAQRLRALGFLAVMREAGLAPNVIACEKNRQWQQAPGLLA